MGVTITGRVPRRVLIGIKVPVHVADAIDDVHESIESYFDGRPVRGNELHITLKFLGELNEQRIAQVEQLLSYADFDPASVSIDRFGTFSDRIVWAHVSGLEELQRQVDEALLDLFAPERRFMGHLTIARMKYVRNAPGLSACLKALKAGIRWEVHHVDLIESKLDRHGAHHTVIASYRTHRDLLIEPG